MSEDDHRLALHGAPSVTLVPVAGGGMGSSPALVFMLHDKEVLKITPTEVFVHGRRVEMNQPDAVEHDHAVYQALKRYCLEVLG